MEIIPILLFSLLIVTLGVVVITLGFYYTNLVAKFNQLQKQNLYLKFHLQDKSLSKLNTTKEKALKILADASEQAANILKQADVLKSEMGEEAKQDLSELTNKQKEALLKATEELKSGFSELLKQIEEEDINLFKSVTKDIENITSTEVRGFEKRLHDETIGQQNTIDQKVKEAFERANQEIETYKKEKMEAVDKQVFSLLQQVAKDVLGKRLTNEDHRQLIMDALKRAKTELEAQV